VKSHGKIRRQAELRIAWSSCSMHLLHLFQVALGGKKYKCNFRTNVCEAHSPTVHDHQQTVNHSICEEIGVDGQQVQRHC
jgi:hypothetical protein